MMRSTCVSGLERGEVEWGGCKGSWMCECGGVALFEAPSTCCVDRRFWTLYSSFCRVWVGGVFIFGDVTMRN